MYPAVVVENLESLGDSITSAVLLSWNKQPGDSIAEDDVIAVVETDKVTMDIRAKKAGVFVEGLVAAQGEISVGSPLFKFDTEGAAAAKPAATPAKAAPAAAPAKAAAPAAAKPATKAAAVMVAVPIMGESITTGVLSSWSVKVGDVVGADHVVATIETDKVNVEVRTPTAGKITKLFSAQGDEVNVGKPLLEIEAGEGAAVAAPAAVPKAEAPKAAAPAAAKAPATAAPAAAAPAKKEAAKPSAAPVAAPAGSRTETRVKMTRMRQRISQRLKDSQNTAAMLTTFQEVDMGNLIDLRNRHKDEFEKVHGVKLGFMSAFVRVSALLLLCCDVA